MDLEMGGGSLTSYPSFSMVKTMGMSMDVIDGLFPIHVSCGVEQIVQQSDVRTGLDIDVSFVFSLTFHVHGFYMICSFASSCVVLKSDL